MKTLCQSVNLGQLLFHQHHLLGEIDNRLQCERVQTLTVRSSFSILAVASSTFSPSLFDRSSGYSVMTLFYILAA